MRVLLTGVAGFIGFHLAVRLLERGDEVIGVDNLNDHYDPSLKLDRLNEINTQANAKLFTFIQEDIANREAMEDLFATAQFDVVVNLAAQAGVRYSLENPDAYIDSNLVGFANILEGCRRAKIDHLVYASSSSIYGMNTKQPFSESDRVDNPVSLYAATKRANELMAYSYSHLYKIPTTGLRFFTVYGPYGRPDMAYYQFTKAILNGDEIAVYNNGEMERDFTYIDDIVEGVLKTMESVPKSIKAVDGHAKAPHKIYNIGNNQPVSLSRFIAAIEEECGCIAKKRMLPMQSGDVPVTYADIDELNRALGFQPRVDIELGIKKFVDWYKKKSPPTRSI